MHSLVSEREAVATQGHHLSNGLLAAEEMDQGFCVEWQFKKCAPVSKQIDEECAQAFSGFVEVAPAFSVYLKGFLRFGGYRIIDKARDDFRRAKIQKLAVRCFPKKQIV